MVPHVATTCKCEAPTRVSAAPAARARRFPSACGLGVPWPWAHAVSGYPGKPVTHGMNSSHGSPSLQTGEPTRCCDGGLGRDSRLGPPATDALDAVRHGRDGLQTRPGQPLPGRGAERGTRTPKGLLPLAPQASASAKFRHLRIRGLARPETEPQPLSLPVAIPGYPRPIPTIRIRSRELPAPVLPAPPELPLLPPTPYRYRFDRSRTGRRRCVPARSLG